jgi:NAD(P)-binding Rossmann-like domain
LRTIETDYLVIGSGTAGLAFADTLIEHSDAHVTIVDRHGQPGGHWNDAYPFVTLHQPSAFYGVNSMELGSGRKDTQGLNQGLYELASGPEISGYFHRVMHHRLLPSGRVAWHPLSNAEADGSSFVSLLTGERTQVTVRRKVVDAAYGGPVVPATHAPRFAVEPGVRLVPPGALPGLWQAALRGERPQHYTVIGAGKTAMDTVVWLLGAGVPLEALQWVVPRDSWLINRVTTQTGPEFFDEAIGGQANQMEACAQATSLQDLFLRLEACGALLRIHTDRMPTMFHLATVTPAEAAVLRRVEQVVRLGRVLELRAAEMVLEQGRVAVPAGTLFIDCTASAVAPRPSQPIFQNGRIVLQLVRLPQPAFSAALIAYVEARYPDDKARNALCGTVPFPYTMADYPRSLMANMWNQFQWGQDKELRQWIRASRLDGFGKLMGSVDKDDAARQATLARFKQAAMGAMTNLPKLVAA